MAAHEAEPRTAPPAAPATAAPPPARRRGATLARHAVVRLLLLLLIVVVAVLIGAVIWGRSDGSLPTALRIAGKYVPLQAEGARGALLGKSAIQRLVWEQDGLRVEVDGARLEWTSLALLARTLDVDTLSADRILIQSTPRTQEPPAEPAAAPPDIPALPLAVQVKDLHAGEIVWAGPPALTLHDVDGTVRTSGNRYHLEIQRLGYDQGHYRATADITATRPAQVAVALSGALLAPVGENQPRLPLTVQAAVQGELGTLAADAHIQLGRAATDAVIPALPEPALQLPPLADPGSDGDPAGGGNVTARARITPWAALPVRDARVTLQGVDLRAVMDTLPESSMDGTITAKANSDATTPGWIVTTHIENPASGPWDQKKLPLEGVDGEVTVHPTGAVDVQKLVAHLGGGAMEASGNWRPSSDASGQAPAADAKAWQVDARLTGINPALLHGQLADLPISGTASAHGEAHDAIVFALGLKAEAATRASGKNGNRALTRDLRALQLRDVDLRGRWADALLTLETLRVRTSDAELAGSAEVRPTDPERLGGKGDLALHAPGLELALKGTLEPDQGAGTLRLALSDAARGLAWLQKLPGASAALAGMGARGAATLDGSWRGGWRDPSVEAALAIPSLHITLPNADEGDAIEVRRVQTRLSGRLAALELSSSGTLAQDKRTVDWTVAADAGRTTPKAALAASSWRATIQRIEVNMLDPDLGKGRWRARLADAVGVRWSPREGLDAAPGALRLTAPEPESTATIAWERTRWHSGTLATAGTLRGVPLAWADRFGGTLTNAGIRGDLSFNGGWDINMGKTLQARVHVERASGDISVVATDDATQTQTRVAAGVQAARVDLSAAGNDVHAQVQWESKNAGQIHGDVRTTLARAQDGAWSLPESAPLSGQIKLEMPSISTWSVLAPPGWRLRGTIQADVRVAGTRAQPDLTGTIAADQLALRSVVDGIFLKRGHLRAHFAGTRLVLDEFLLYGAGRGENGGSVRATGEAGLADGTFKAHMDTVLDKLHASASDDRQVTLSGQLKAGYDGKLLTADGTIHIDEALIILPDDSRPSLGSDVVVHGLKTGQVVKEEKTSAAAREQARKEAKAGQPPSALRSRINVGIDLGDDFRLEGMGIDTRLAGKLDVVADGPISDMPTVKGRVTTVGGTFHAYGQRLNIDQGNIYFSGDATNPGLNVLALRPNYTSDQRVGVQIQGTALLPQVKLYSDPVLPDSQTLAWLILGHAAPQTGAEAAVMQSAALALLSGRKGKGLASSFGLDELSFSQGDGGDNKGGLTLGKRLSDRLYAAYEQGLGGTGSALMIFYELSKRWLLRGQAGQDSALDLIFRLSYGSGD